MKAIIRFLPVCSNCGRVIPNEIDCQEDTYQPRRNSIFVKECTIIPHFCPFCNAEFNQITMPTRLPFNMLD